MEHPAVDVIRAEKQWMCELFRLLADGDETLAQTWHLLYEGAQINAAIQGSAQPFEAAHAASEGARVARLALSQNPTFRSGRTALIDSENGFPLHVERLVIEGDS